jgi:hypothetical protein
LPVQRFNVTSPEVKIAAKPTLLSRTPAPNLVVSRESFESPLDSEWNEFLKLMEANRENFEKLRILVVTEGGGPNSAQRGRLQEVLRGKPVRVAVVTDSAKSRFIASAVSLFNRDHRGFWKSEMALAYEHLGLTAVERRLVEAALAQMAPLIK